MNANVFVDSKKVLFKFSPIHIRENSSFTTGLFLSLAHSISTGLGAPVRPLQFRCNHYRTYKPEMVICQFAESEVV